MKLDHGDMVANILTYRRSATDEQESQGRAWYRVAFGIVNAIAIETGMPTHRVALALAALSPRNPWRWNVADTYAYASARAEGRLMPSATTFRGNQLRAWQALSETGQDDIWSTAAPKVRSFVAAVMGDEESIVVDVWAMRVATGGRTDRVSTKQYPKVVAAYRDAAKQLDESPREVQAIAWLVAQTEGLATMRRGRHDLSDKAGTPPFIIHLLDGGADAT